MFDETIALLAARWRRAGPLWAAFPLLADGRPLEIARLVEACHLDNADLEAVLEGVRSERDAHGRLLDLFGMTLNPTQHRLVLGGGSVFACCALWAHVIPRLVGRGAVIETTDPQERRLLQLEISPDGVVSAAPPDVAATVAVVTGDSLRAGVEAAFCSHVRHFGSRGSAERFAREHTARRVVSVKELDAMGSDLLTAIRAAAAE